MRQGLFITFEGGEGSGKTTQINRLAEALTVQGHKVVTTREPGGTPESEKIRDFLVQREGGNWSPMAEALLLFAAREMHYNAVIQPALEKGKIVICDRFSDSTRAYQGYGHGLSLERLEQLKLLAIGDVEPDITFVLDIEAKEGLARSQKLNMAQPLERLKQEDRFENMDVEFHERLRDGFLKIVEENSERCHLIEAEQALEVINAQILDVVSKRLA